MAKATREICPNILWVSFEDTNPFYGCYGDPTAKTPNLDRLARDGVIFTNCYSTAGVCAPARSAVITGMYPISIGTHHMRTTHTDPQAPDLPTPYSAVLPHYVKCFTEYLRAAGYYCTNNVKTDYQFDPPCTAWDELSTDAHWRNRPDRDQPFFAVFNPTRTHESGMWEEKTPEIEIDPDSVRIPPYFPDTPRVRRSIAKMHGNIARSDRELGELLAQLDEDGLSENTVVMHWSDHGPLPRGKRWPYDSGIRMPLIIRWPTGAGNPGAGNAGSSSADAADFNTAVRATVNAAGGHMPENWNDKSSGTSAEGSAAQSAGAPDVETRAPIRGFAPGSVTDRIVSTIDLGPTVLSLAGLEIPQHMQGRAFLGTQAQSEREYIFASRDRYDTSYDMIRACRDRRFKYIRHFVQTQERLIWVPYRNRHPIMQELYDGYRAGTLSKEQLALFADRPAEELYDVASDPYELRNLAGEPEYADRLIRLRRALDEWRAEVGDMGEMSESEMVRSWYPDGAQPVTAAPICVPIGGNTYGEKAVEDMEIKGPALLQIQCSTQGASIAYRFSDDPLDRWRLYHKPIPVPSRESVVQAKAIRIGYRESPVTTISLLVM